MSDNLIASMLLVGYYAAFAAVLGGLARLFDIPREVLRKAYHMSCGLSVFILLYAFSHWQAAVFAISLMLLAGYVLLLAGDRIPMAAVSIDRGGGIAEIREHLLFMLLSMVLLLTVFWGLLGEHARYAVAVGMLAWGFGDASASLVGGRFAHRCFGRFPFDPKKSPLGTGAMMFSAALVSAFALLLMTPLPAVVAVACAVLLGVLAGLVEAVTRRGLDTLTVPLATGFASYPLVQFAGRQFGV